MTKFDHPLFTSEMTRAQFQLPAQAVYIYGLGDEEQRSNPSDEWLMQLTKFTEKIKWIKEQKIDAFTFSDESGVEHECSLLDPEEIFDGILSSDDPVYLDITALSHRVWAPIVQAAIRYSVALQVVYMEPSTYRKSTSPAVGMIYDLSKSIEGISPIPGFVRIAPSGEDRGYFVPMVGFEGARFAHILERIEADLAKTYPIVGVPGFRPEYSFNSYHGNRDSLVREYLASRVNLAKANCPFDAFHVLSDVHRWSGFTHLRIAPIGTKPHALGAILFAIARYDLVEIVYDHPVRSPKRTSGEGRLCVYDVDSFVQTSVFKDQSFLIAH
ncbi:hypothetical protein XU06_21415 [Rhodococcus erythropolis]|uniref:hypothetical protein n=1 Tax=Rhodococcus erythropolis TaxID=1833 RepID=UPI00061B7D13|nr:hypothetical protein [Rhodococcus erythropolis]AKD98957.1 hypothetical protein XU06_21415 [Rhodococcus erythropolis]